jgi:hypothetical protein
MTSELLIAAAGGDLLKLQSLFASGADMTARDRGGNTALLLAVRDEHFPIFRWLLLKGIASNQERNNAGSTALLCAASRYRLYAVEWLLGRGISDIGETRNDGKTVWDLLGDCLCARSRWAVMPLLRVMVLRGAPPADLVLNLSERISSERGQTVRDGARLREKLPAYLAQRQELLVEHIPLIAPLQALVSSYAEPSTEECWATGLGNPAERECSSRSSGYAYEYEDQYESESAHSSDDVANADGV